MFCNARFPLGPSDYAPILTGSILNTTGPAAPRKVAGEAFQLKRDPAGGSLREPNGSLLEKPVLTTIES